MNRRDRLYNYIVNKFGISKEMVYKYIDTRLEDLVAKHLKSKLDSKNVEYMILNTMSGYLKDGLKGNCIWGYQNSFEEFFRDTVKKEVKKIIEERYSIEIKENE